MASQDDARKTKTARVRRRASSRRRSASARSAPPPAPPAAAARPHPLAELFSPDQLILVAALLVSLGVLAIALPSAAPAPPPAPAPAPAVLRAPRVSESFARLAGTVSRGGEPVASGVLVVASVDRLPERPPVPRRGKKPRHPVYATMSGPDGAYRLTVRAGARPYNVRAFYAGRPGLGLPSLLRRGVSVGPGDEATGLDFAWP